MLLEKTAAEQLLADCLKQLDVQKASSMAPALCLQYQRSKRRRDITQNDQTAAEQACTTRTRELEVLGPRHAHPHPMLACQTIRVAVQLFYMLHLAVTC